MACFSRSKKKLSQNTSTKWKHFYFLHAFETSSIITPAHMMLKGTNQILQPEWVKCHAEWCLPKRVFLYERQSIAAVTSVAIRGKGESASHDVTTAKNKSLMQLENTLRARTYIHTYIHTSIHSSIHPPGLNLDQDLHQDTPGEWQPQAITVCALFFIHSTQLITRNTAQIPEFTLKTVAHRAKIQTCFDIWHLLNNVYRHIQRVIFHCEWN